jgi:hypothetical protein
VLNQENLPRLHFIGGELMAWSDAGHDPAGGSALGVVLRRFTRPGQRVLVAGPHADELVDLLVDGQARVTCLVRSHSDALTLARRHAGHPQIRVFCGTLDKLSGTEPYDLVVALDGLSRLDSPDGTALDWATALDHLTGTVAPTGTLLLAVENPLGVHRLADARPPARTQSGAGWRLHHEFDQHRPEGHGVLLDRLREADLVPVATYAGYPGPSRPTVLVRAGELDPAAALPPALTAEVAAAFSANTGTGPLLQDPRRLARTALRGGLGTALAPVWLVVAPRSTAPLPDEARPGGGDGGDALPTAIVAGGAYAGHWDVPVGYERGPDDQWHRRLLDGTEPDGLAPAGRVGRTPGLLTGPVSGDQLLDELLLRSCAEHDLPGVRELLRGYAGWLAGQQIDGQVSGQLVFATTDNVVTDGHRHALLDPSWQLSQPVPLALALNRALRRFAVTLLSTALPHPWPHALDVDGLTVSLAAAAGHPIDRSAASRAAVLECEVQAGQRLLDADAEQELYCELTSVVAQHAGLAARSYRDLVAGMSRLAGDLLAAREQVAWNEQRAEWREDRLRDREKLLQIRDRQLRGYRNSGSFRVGRMMTAPLRVAVRAVRGTNPNRGPR